MHKYNKFRILVGVFGAVIVLVAASVFFRVPVAYQLDKAFQPSYICPEYTGVRSDNKVFDARTIFLDNGLQVIVVENHRAPVVTHMIWYRAGAADEPRGKSGIAHFLEHLMFKGQKSDISGDLAPGEFSRIIQSLGGQHNAFTTQDFTAYYESVASENLEKVMRMEAGRMRGLNVPPAEFSSEKKVILEERRQRTDNDPRAKMAEQLDYALFPNHPYGISTIGWFHEMEALNWDDAKAFYDLYYRPNNAILIVSGDVETQKVFDLADKIYGRLEPLDTPARVRTFSPPFVANTAITLKDPTIQLPVFMRKIRVPSYRENAKDSLALEVLQEIMSGGASSRLYKSLVVGQKIAAEVSLGYDGVAWDNAIIGISASPAQGYDIDDVTRAVDVELRKLVRDGVTDEELDDAVTRLIDRAVYARDSLEGPAMVIGYNVAVGACLDDIENWPDQIKHITKEDVLHVAQSYLDPDTSPQYPSVEGILLPKNPEVKGKK